MSPALTRAERFNKIEEVENMLSQLKIDNKWSMTKLATEVKNRGICLFDGQEYGKTLRKNLKADNDLIVKKNETKGFRHARKCLIVLNP